MSASLLVGWGTLVHTTFHPTVQATRSLGGRALGLAGALGLAACAGPSSGVPLDYQAGTLHAYATLHAPPPGSLARAGGTTRFPAVVVLHGGFWGDDKASETIAHEVVDRGAIAVVPAYRGEKRSLDGKKSDGEVEFCGGEVDDAQALLRALRRRPDVDPSRISVVGSSHGGCIALRLAAREPSLASVVTFAAPTDAVYTYRNLDAHPMGMLGFAGWLRGRVESYVGGTPAQKPEAWAARSAVREAAAIKQPLVLIQGLDDVIVPVQEACLMRDALHAQERPIIERYFDKNGVEAPPEKPACWPVPGALAPSAASAVPVEVWYYAGEGHGFSSKIAESSQARAYDVLLAPPASAKETPAVPPAAAAVSLAGGGAK